MAALIALIPGLLSVTPSVGHAQSERLSGAWEGAIETPGTALQVQLSFRMSGDVVQGTVSLPQQGATDVPLTGILATADSAIFAIQGVPGDPTFRGAWLGDTAIAGAFHQGGGSFPFSVRRPAAAAAATGDPLAGLDAVIDAALADFTVPGLAIGILHRGEVVYSRGFGHRDVARQLPVSPQTVFSFGSSTKAFTAFALGQLVDDGELAWDQPVREYLPGLQLWDDMTTLQLTTRDMLTHRTGLPRHDFIWYNNDSIDARDVFERLRHFEPNRELREAWQYNNIMYVLAGHLLSEVTGRSWQDHFRERIFEPLGMASTNLSINAMRAAPDHALAYRLVADTIALAPFRHIDVAGPAGSINSNIEDMLKWLRVQLQQGRVGEQQLIRGPTLREMHLPQMVMPGMPTDAEMSPVSYGMGWMINTYRGKYRVQHGGNIDGFSALVTLFPRDQLGIVVLTNLNGTPLPSAITDVAADRMLELSDRGMLATVLRQVTAARAVQTAATDRLDEERVTGTRPTFPLDQYAGQYGHPGYGTIDISLDGSDGRLVMRYNRIVTPLDHWHYDVFNGSSDAVDPVFASTKVQFSSDLRGRVDALALTLEPLLAPIRFARAGDAQLRDPAFLARLAGRYAIEGGGAFVISVQGNQLMMDLPGQPAYTLEPQRDLEFTLSGLSGYTLRFIMEDGAVKAARMVQPNGVFVATPVR